MSAKIINNQVVLEATGAGFQQARIPLPTAPVGSDMMVFAFRYFYDTYAADEGPTDYGWDAADSFGLSFDGVFPTEAIKSNFFGWINDNASSVFNYEAAWAEFNGEDAVNGSGDHNVYDGEGNVLGDPVNQASRFSEGMARPANPTVGAKYTGVWIIKKDDADLAKINISIGGNFESLADLSDARTAAATIFGDENNPITVGNSGNWRSGGGMNFPIGLMMTYTSNVNARKFILDSYEVEFYQFCS